MSTISFQDNLEKDAELQKEVLSNTLENALDDAGKTVRAVRILPAHLINRIAAGEVVERPASVVKELVENALDAGASRIEITAGEAGRMLRIADNGSGMAADDAKLAFYNHATSKIQDVSDLDRITTLGFRGEALASIAAISKLVCLTRTEDAQSGFRVEFDPNGTHPEEPILSPTGCSAGTVMEVSDLFYNTPARLKFLKRPATELGHIGETVETLALSHPQVRFRLISNGKQTLQTSGSGDLKQTIHEVFGFEFEGVNVKLKDIQKKEQALGDHSSTPSFKPSVELIAVEKSDPDAAYAVKGFTSSPGLMKSSKRWLITFINGRTVRCHLMQKAIEAAYESLLPQGRYPICVLHVSLPNDEVDVNVHPTKREVRYANTQSVFSFIRVAVKEALESFGYTASRFESFVNADQAPDKSSIGVNAYASLPNFSPGSFLSSDSFPLPELPGNAQTQVQTSITLPYSDGGAFQRNPVERPSLLGLEAANKLYSERPSESTASIPPATQYRVLGQLFNTYILLETVQGLMVVDQHIASERELFERISQQILSQQAPAQHCMDLLPITLSLGQTEILDQHRKTFLHLGFDYALDMENKRVALKSVPLIYQDRAPNQNPKRLFEDLLQQLENTGEAQLALDHQINHLVATLACHTAVRAGDSLSQNDMEKVINGWLSSTLPWTCPHGRPIAHTINKNELNRFFHRPSLPVNQ